MVLLLAPSPAAQHTGSGGMPWSGKSGVPAEWPQAGPFASPQAGREKHTENQAEKEGRLTTG